MSPTYAELLRHPLWQRKRLQIMDRDNFACLNCGEDDETLNVHHIIYIPSRKPWEYEDHLLQTLCEFCHENRHFKKITPDANLKSIGEILSEPLPGTLLEKLRKEVMQSDNEYETFDADSLRKCWIIYIGKLTIEREINLVNAYCMAKVFVTGDYEFQINTYSLLDKETIENSRKSLSVFINTHFKSLITFKIIANEEIKKTA